MSFNDIAKKIKYPNKTTQRFKTLDAYDRLLASTFYDHITVPFDVEDDGAGYVKLRDRRPSVIWDGAALIVQQLGGLLWGDEQMPLVRTYYGDEPTDADRQAGSDIQHLVEELELDEVMLEVTEVASTGSACIILRAMADKSVYIDVVPGKQVTPIYDPRNPNKLRGIEHLYSLTGQDLRNYGYQIAEDDLVQDFWYRLTIDDKVETRYKPLRADKYERLGQKDAGVTIAWEVAETIAHGLGEPPIIWAKAPGRGASPFDGACIFGKVVDSLVEIDYQLSQVGRGFKYSADPMLAIRRGEMRGGATPTGFDSPFGDNGNVENQTMRDAGGRIIKSPNNVIDLEPGAEAKLLEITGKGLEGALDYVKMLREYALEVVGGMKSDSETEKGVQSGRALEMLFQALVLLVKRWRISLGNNAFVRLVRLLLIALDKNLIEVEGLTGKLDPNTILRLVWPAWMTPAGADLLATVGAWQTLAGGSAQAPVPLLPRRFVTELAGVNLGAPDTAAIVDELEAQVKDDDAKAQAQADADTQRSTDAAVKIAAAKPQKKGPANA